MNRPLPPIKLNQTPFIIILFFSLIFSGQALGADEQTPRGYLVTKNGKKLTGSISEVFGENQILFINDFGTPYKIHAALIYGFVINRQGKNIFYASKFSGKKWHFMQLLYKGESMNLYSAPIIQLQNNAFNQFGGGNPKLIHSDAFFVEINGRLPVQVSRVNFKKSMRRLLKTEAPELAKLIGSKGYRFKNLQEIILKYNEIIQKSLISL